MDMVEYDIGVMPGDYLGKEVTAEALKVMQKAAEFYGFTLRTEHYPHGGEHFRETGELLPDHVLNELRDFKAYLFGAVGDPDVDPSKLEREILLKMRFELDQYINFRPSKLYEGVDSCLKRNQPDLPYGFEIIVFREGVEGLYTGKGGVERDASGKVIKATQIMEYTLEGVERINRQAFAYATKRKEGGKDMPVILGGKSNVLEYVFQELWMPNFEEVGSTFPDIERHYRHIDALTGPGTNSALINRETGIIIVTSNMFGDIITDKITEDTGGMGGGPSGSMNPEGTSMFEPIGGSSPKDYGKAVACPVGAILSGALLIRHLGEEEAAVSIETAVENACRSGRIPDFTIGSGVKTQQQTQAILEEMDWKKWKD